MKKDLYYFFLARPVVVGRDVAAWLSLSCPVREANPLWLCIIPLLGSVVSFVFVSRLRRSGTAVCAAAGLSNN